MNLICWDFIIKNDILNINHIKQYFYNNNIKYLYQIFDEKICLFFFIWDTNLSLKQIYNEISNNNKIIIEKTHITINIDNKINILYWDINLINEKDKFINIDISQNQDINTINDILFKNINMKSYKLVITQKTYFDDYLKTENIRMIIIF